MDVSEVQEINQRIIQYFLTNKHWHDKMMYSSPVQIISDLGFQIQTPVPNGQIINSWICNHGSVKTYFQILSIFDQHDYLRDDDTNGDLYFEPGDEFQYLNTTKATPVNRHRDFWRKTSFFGNNLYMYSAFYDDRKSYAGEKPALLLCI